MKKRILAAVLSLVLALSLLPVSVLAVEGDPGSSPENPIEATLENGAFIFNPEMGDYTLYGISREWFQENNPDGGVLYISVTIPADVEVISPYCMTNTYTEEKEKHGVVFEEDGRGTFEVVSVDFSAASYLNTIGDYAFYDCQNMTGTFDMSNTEYITVIGDYAFYNCSNMTGDIDMSASWELKEIGDYAFYNCSSLTGVLSFGENHYYGPFDRIGDYAFYNCQKITGVDMSSANSNLSKIGDYAFYNCVSLAYFDWPSFGKDTVIGESAFENCTALQFADDVLPGWVDEVGDNAFRNAFSGDTRIYLGNGVKTIGANAFASDKISQIVFEEDRRHTYKYDVSAFETGSPSLLIVFEEQNDYNSFIEEMNPSADLEKRLAYPVTIRFHDKTNQDASIETQQKLNHQSIAYEKAGDFWVYNENYELPVIQEPIVTTTGYTSGWEAENVILNENTILNFSDDVVNKTYIFEPTTEPVLLNPVIVPIVNGIEQSSFSDLVVTLGEETSTVGVSVSHPLLRSEDGTDEDYVYFEYAWWDEKDNRVNGPRNETEGDLFSDVPKPGVYDRDWTDNASIPITSTEHTRTDGDGYLVEIRGIHVKNGQKETFYKSHENFIHFGSDHDTEATVQDVYVLHVTVKEAPVYSITTDEEALDFGTVDTGYTPPAAQTVTITNTGNQSVTIQLPALDGYTITAGEGWEDNSITLAPNVAATFTVQPVAGLDAGTYDATLTITGTKDTNTATATVALSFTVQSNTGGGSGTGGGTGGSQSDPYLRFDSNGGTAYAPIDGHGSAFTINPYDDDEYGTHIPSRPGYRFTGWYRDSHLTMRVDEDTSIRVTGSMTLFAGWAETSVPSVLNGDDHYAYIQGYSDGSVRPNANITRAQVATIFFRLLDEDVRDDYLTTYNTFPDVNEDYWANTAISTMAALGVINGRNSGYFDPDAYITRAEFAAICARFDDSGVSGVTTFTDTDGHWAEDEISRAAALGWIQGYSDGTFHPNQYITRAQAVAMINRVLCRLPEDESDLLPGMNTWTDCHEGDWFYLAIQEATNSHDFVAKDRVYETWTDLNRAPDWSRYE